MEIVIPNFEILFKFPTFYDYFLYVAENWFVDPSSKVGSLFTSAFKIFLEYIYNFDNEFWNTCNHTFQNVAEVAFKLIPLIIILTLARTMRLAAESSAGGTEKIRVSIINLLVNIGLAVSCGYIAKFMVKGFASLSIEILKMSGVKVIVENGIITNMDEVAQYIFLTSTYSMRGGFGTAMDIVLIFMRLFFVIVMTVSIGFSAVTIRVAIIFLFTISTVMFVIAGYEELEWVRDMWVRGFVSISIMPSVISIIITLILTINYNAQQKGIKNLGEAFALIGMSAALALIIAMVQTFILTQILDYSVSTVKNAVKSVANFVPNTIAFAAAVKTGGVKGGLKKMFGMKSSPQKKGTPEKGDSASDAKRKSENGLNSSKEDDEKKLNSGDQTKNNNVPVSDLNNRINRMANGYKRKYGLSDEEINDPDNEKNKKINEEMKHAFRAFTIASKVFKDRNEGKDITTASQDGSDPFQTDYLNERGGADMVLLGNAMDTAAYRGTHGGQGVPRHRYESDMYGHGMNADDSDAFNNISRITDRAIDWSSSGYDDQTMYNAINSSFDVSENEGRPVSFV